MHGVSIKDRDRILQFVDRVIVKLEEIGLHLNVHSDLALMGQFLERSPKTHGLSRTLDPAFHNIQPEDAFWLSLDTAEDRHIACVGCRVFEVRDFFSEIIATHLIFDSRKPLLRIKPFKLVGTPPVLRGRVVYGGNSYVHPDWRGRDLSTILSRLYRTIALQYLRADWHTAFIQTHREEFIIGLGWPKKRHIMSGHHPGRDDASFTADVNFCWASREQTLGLCDRPIPLIDQQRFRKIA